MVHLLGRVGQSTHCSTKEEKLKFPENIGGIYVQKEDFITPIERYFYFKMNIDWLGYEYVQKVKDWSVNKTGIMKFIGIILKKSDLVLFMVLSTFRDSFETTAYFKYCYHLSKGKTISIFITSVIVSNLYWSFGVEVFINSWLRYLINI